MPSCVCALVVHDCDLGFNLPAGGTPALLIRSQGLRHMQCASGGGGAAKVVVVRAWMGWVASIAIGGFSLRDCFCWEYPFSCRHSVLADGVLWNMASPVKHVDGPP